MKRFVARIFVCVCAIGLQPLSADAARIFVLGVDNSTTKTAWVTSSASGGFSV